MKSFESAFEIIADKHKAALLLKRSGIMNSIVDKIKSRGLTQAEAAEIMGVTQPRVSNLLTGRISKFSFDMLYLMDSKITEGGNYE
jgi:predicted XRE-type DNA-binding protein